MEGNKTEGTAHIGHPCVAIVQSVITDEPLAVQVYGQHSLSDAWLPKYKCGKDYGVITHGAQALFFAGSFTCSVQGAKNAARVILRLL